MRHPHTRALIDADVLLYRVTRANERDAQFDEDTHILFSDFNECRAQIEEDIQALLDKTGCKSFRLYLSGDRNWRKDVMPSYKNHRKDTRKPLAFARLKQYLEDTYDCQKVDRLEADDLLGIDGALGGGIIVSLDKDFFTIPGWFARIGMDWEVTIHHTTAPQARYYHFLQAFMGDRTDGYAGCPGIGPKSAEKAINKVVAFDGLVQESEALNVWQMIVDNYTRQGLTVDDAVENYMVSKILDGVTGLYDFDKNQVTIELPHGVIHHV